MRVELTLALPHVRVRARARNDLVERVELVLPHVLAFFPRAPS